VIVRRSLTLTAALRQCGTAFMYAALLAARVAIAQTPSIESTSNPRPRTADEAGEKRARAHSHFQRGLELGNVRRDWDAALGEFLESRAIFPTRSATRNAAVALRELGRFADAFAMYDMLLSEFSGSTPEAEVAAYRLEQSALGERLGELALQPADPGISVTIDGKDRGTTPRGSSTLLDVGMHMVRLAKDGCETLERQVLITAGGKKTMEARLKQLVGTGTLIVNETNDEILDVVVDSVVLGRTPWRGNITAGPHSVLLRAPQRGTAPTTIEVKAAQSVTLRLDAVVLDANVIVKPIPEGATVFVDGVFVGNGAWRGALASGPHRFEAVAPEYLPFRSEAVLTGGKTEIVHARLERNRVGSGMADRVLARSLFSLEPSVGLLLASSLRGGVDAACGCQDRSRPFGWLFSARFGYSPVTRLSIDLTAGYLTISERSVHSIVAQTEAGISDFTAVGFQDKLSLSGGFAMLGISARFFRRFPVTLRVAGGLAAFTAKPSNNGTFSGSLPVNGTSAHRAVTQAVSIVEPSTQLTTPLASTEIRVGYQFNQRFSADVGLALSAFFPRGSVRSERHALVGSPETGVRNRPLTLPDEVMARTFIAWVPSAAARIEF
jgi:hypothetical protein